MKLTKLVSTKQIDSETCSIPGPVQPVCGAGHFGRICLHVFNVKFSKQN